jgi:hypothetical protein
MRLSSACLGCRTSGAATRPLSRFCARAAWFLRPHSCNCMRLNVCTVQLIAAAFDNKCMHNSTML